MTDEQIKFKAILDKHCEENFTSFTSNDFHTIYNAVEEYIQSQWIEYDFNVMESRPPKYGRYFVMRKDGKVHWEVWNGNGWAYNNESIVAWMNIIEYKPKENTNEIPELNLKFINKLSELKDYTKVDYRDNIFKLNPISNKTIGTPDGHTHILCNHKNKTYMTLNIESPFGIQLLTTMKIGVKL